MEKESIILKGKYQYKQIEGLISLKQFFFLKDKGRKGKKTVALRFMNERNEPCYKFAFVLYRLDAKGNVLGAEKYESGVTRYANTPFSFEKQITVEPNCTDFRIQLLYAVYGNYVYNVEKEGVSVTYSEKKTKRSKTKIPRVIKAGGYHMPWVYAIVALVILGLAFLATGYLLSDFVQGRDSFSLSSIEYTFVTDDEGDEVIVTGCSGQYRTVVIPEEIEGYRVVGIADSAFRRNRYVRTLTVEGSIPIGENAFYDCENLTTLNIKNVTEIGNRAFFGCESLTSVKLENVSSIGLEAFAYCSSLLNVTVTTDKEGAEGYLTMGERAFENCNVLDTVVIDQMILYPSDVNIFSGDRNLKNLTLKNYAYTVRDGDTVVSRDDSDGRVISLFDERESTVSLENLEIEFVDNIYPQFCKNISSLKSVSIQTPGVTVVEEQAFYGCVNLKTVQFYSKITEVADYAFYHTAITFFDATDTVYIGSNSFANCASLATVNINDVSSMSRIGDSAFKNCTSLNSIVIPKRIKEIKQETFSGCSSLTTVEFARDGELAEIGTLAFKDSALASISVPDSVERLGLGVFQGCNSLNSLTVKFLGKTRNDVEDNFLGYLFGYYKIEIFSGMEIPSSLSTVTVDCDMTEIPDYAFYGCKGVRRFYLSEDIRKIGAYAFYGCSSLSSYVGLEDVEEIGSYAFAYCGLTSVTLPEAIVRLNDGVFKGNASLSRVTLYDTLKYINDEAFEGCAELTEIDVDNVQYVGSFAFANTGLKSVALSPYAEYGMNIFEGCTSLEEMTYPIANSDELGYLFGGYNGTVPKSLRRVNINAGSVIDYYYFSSCRYINFISLPETVYRVDSTAFNGCYRLYEICNDSQTIVYYAHSPNTLYFSTSKSVAPTLTVDGFTFAQYGGEWYLISYPVADAVTVPEEISGSDGDFNYVNLAYNIPQYLFYEEDTVKEITFGSNVKEIGIMAFNDADSLTSVTFNNNTSIKKISSEAFAYCDSLTNVVLPSGVEYIESMAFYNCYNLTTAEMPTSLVGIESGAFAQCGQLNGVKLYGSLEYIADGAFANCPNLYDVYYNGGMLNIVAGSRENGYVARNAVVVHTNMSDGLSSNVTVNGIGEFRNFSNNWLLLQYTDSKETVTLSTFTSGGRNVSSYRIGAWAFRDNHSIKKLTVESCVKQIQEGAFYGCTSLKEVTLKCTIDTIENDTFSGCTGLYSAVLPDTVQTIEANAFYNCNYMESVNLPSRLMSIGNNAFYNCRRLFSVTVPSQMVEISSNAFGECYNLKEVVNLSGIAIGKNSYNGSIGLNAYQIVNSYNAAMTRKNLGGIKYAYYNGNWYLYSFDYTMSGARFDLESPGNDFVILEYALEYFDYESMMLPTTLRKISSNAFYGSSVSTIYYEGSSSQWNNYVENYGYSRYNNIYYYSGCVHDYTTWTYVNGQISTDQTQLEYSVIRQATCQSEGEAKWYCPVCDRKTTYVTLGKIQHNYKDGFCTQCGLKEPEKINLSQYMESSGAGWVELHGFIYTDDNGGRFIVSNPDNGSSSTVSLTATATVTITFLCTVSSEANCDVASVSVTDYYGNVRNIETMSGEQSRTVTVTLQAGETLRIVYEKDGSVSAGSDSVIVSDFEFIYN